MLYSVLPHVQEFYCPVPELLLNITAILKNSAILRAVQGSQPCKWFYIQKEADSLILWSSNMFGIHLFIALLNSRLEIIVQL